MNHLPNPEDAISEAYRVLRPDGSFAFTVWAAPRPSEGFGIVLSAIEEHGVPNPDLPPAPPYFRFADDREVRRCLEASGFCDVKTSIVSQIWHHDTPDQVFDAFNEGAVRATAMLQSQPKAARELIRIAVKDKVMGLRNGESYEVPVPAALSVARK